MSLPDKFQFRTKTNLGFTHTAKKNANGDYEVEWAKGWLKLNNNTDPWIVAPDCDIKHFVESGGWLIVNDTPKVAEQNTLPDEFLFQCFGKGTIYTAKRVGDSFNVTWVWDEPAPDCPNFCLYSETTLRERFARGDWKILDKKPLTAEQKRANKEFQEQIQQLESSIRIQEQTIEHHTRMICNYMERIETIKGKIVEEV